MEKYNDIINLEYHKSNKHNHMSLNDRAAQFMPFAALTGYDDAIFEEGRITDKKIILNNEQRSNISDKLNMLEQNLNAEVSITYFLNDNKKSGGKYVVINGYIKKIDTFNKIVVMKDKTIINIMDILDIESNLFNNFID